jgi:GTP-binding protein
MAPPDPPTVMSANFLMEVRPRSPLPVPGAPEIAIAGRSNVGKSTLLNRLVGRRALARTSKTPGRTRGIMFYDLELRVPASQPDSQPGSLLSMRLVDLPGYGYAQVSQEERKSWQPMIEGYVEKRATLALFLTLVDARRDLGGEERQLIEWLDSLGVSQRVVVTKVDKMTAAARGALGDRLRRAQPEGLPPPLLVSGETGEGVDRLWALIIKAARPSDQPE